MTLAQSYNEVVIERDALKQELIATDKAWGEACEDRDKAAQQRNRLRKVLIQVEWVGDGCPVCYTHFGFEHYSGCQLHAALTATGGE